jgi:tRNA 2-thiocytidine biosynthesis protein TtcA
VQESRTLNTCWKTEETASAVVAKTSSSFEKKMAGLVGRAVRYYDLIADGDRIAVAVSGGKDSLCLLYLLKERLRWVPISYELAAIHLDLGFEGSQPEKVGTFCRELGVPFHLEQTDFGLRAHGPLNRENPCFLCAWLRRKRLFELSRCLNFTKLALGHNKDDIIETLFLNLCYSGEMATMVPKQPLFGGRLTLIRPLALLEERQIAKFSLTRGFPEIENPCPSSRGSLRREIKTLLNGLYANNSKIKGNIFRAMSNVRLDYMLPPLPKRKH